ncbi:MAG: glycoside hydrolase family 3 N-terminal domain-containing protein [Candidatus Marinimicrobia bacterium]|nr:glycoside hydrolase family 3 N-terminal domain-containing protein [Candidatus Neomarinimicrobiota bacterium]
MTNRIIRTLVGGFGLLLILACSTPAPAIDATPWARRTLKRLTLRQKIAQMMVYHMRLDYLSAESARWQEIEQIISTDGLGSLHVWGGDASAALTFLNEMQMRSRVPIMVQADLEYGLKRRFKGGTALPWPMALTATGDPDLAFEAGRITAEEGRALGIHVALTPIVDVNNNPDNPIINTRGYSEDPDQVIQYATRFMQGLQAYGMLATAKHFPGHGDTQTDSHSSLARIPSDPERLWAIELKPFQALIDAGVDLVMVGHLDAGEFQMEPGVPSSLSPFWLHDILRKQMGFKGVIITDAMAMGGITNEYSDRYALIQTIRAGSDLIIQNHNYLKSIDYVEEAVRDGLLSEARIDESVLRILTLKSKLGLDRKKTLNLTDTQQAYGSNYNKQVSELIMERAVTLVKDSLNMIPLQIHENDTTYLIDIKDWAADHDLTTIKRRLIRSLPTAVSYTLDSSDPQDYYSSVLAGIPDSAQVIVNVYSYTKMRKDRVLLPEKQAEFIRSLASRTDRLLVSSFGTPYLIRDFPEIPAYMVAYTTQSEMQSAVASAILGQTDISGALPISIPGIASHGQGLHRTAVPHSNTVQTVVTETDDKILFHVAPEEVGSDPGFVMPHVNQALVEHAWPGGVLLAAKDGKIFLHEYFGSHTYANERNTYRGDVFDLASVTKVIATTSAAMKLYEQGKLDLDTTVVSYLPEFTGPDSLNTALKATITIKQLLTHTAGMKPFKRFYNMDAPDSQSRLDSVFQAELDTLPGTRYRYSDIGLITLGKVIERLSGTDLNTFTDSLIFRPLAMTSTGYLPENPLDQIVPTEYSEIDSGFVHGYVHDENSHSLGGITGHAGLFSVALDLARFAQMMLNQGTLGDTVIFQPETIKLFTQRADLVAEEEDGRSRCLGWDSPSGPSSGGVYLSPNSFGHTGFTGTSIWIDPDNQIFVILLTNAVHPDRRNKYPGYYDWRQRIHSGVYESLGFTEITQELELKERWAIEQKYRKTWRYKLLHLFRTGH